MYVYYRTADLDQKRERGERERRREREREEGERKTIKQCKVPVNTSYPVFSNGGIASIWMCSGPRK